MTSMSGGGRDETGVTGDLSSRLSVTLRLWGNWGYFIQEVRKSAAGV